MVRNSLVLLLALALSGCYTWQRIDEKSAAIDGGQYELLAPVGWVQIKVNNHLVITKDGPDLQKLQVSVWDHDKAFEEIEKKSSPEMLPAELADLYIAKVRKERDNGFPSLNILSNRPVSIGGTQGFELVMTYKVSNGLLYKHKVTGFAKESGLFLINYQAPELHYYPIDQAEYEKLLQSFKLKV